MAQVDTNATTETKALYTQLQNAQGNYIYYGQENFIHFTYGNGGADSYLITGKYPYFLEDHWREANDNGYLNETTSAIKKHYRNGGISGIMFSMSNPIVGSGGEGDLTGGDVIAECLPGGSKRTEYLSKLDTFSNWCNNLSLRI